MATLTYRNKKVSKIEVVIKDYVNKSKYKEKFLPWINISEIKTFIFKKNGFPRNKQRLFNKQNE